MAQGAEAVGPEAPRREAAAARRTLALALLMAAVGVILALYARRWGAPPAHLRLTWWELAAAVALTNEMAFHFEVRGEAHAFNLGEVALVLGCLFAPPGALIIARMVGGTVSQVLRMRTRGVKLAFNLATFFLETSVVLVLYRALIGDRHATSWIVWPLVLLAVLAADLVSMAAVSRAIRWHGGQPHMGSVLVAGLVAAVVNVDLALLVSVIVDVNVQATILLLVVVAAVAAAYRGYAGLAKRYANLKLLYDFTEAIGTSAGAEAVIERMLTKARELLVAETAEIVLVDRQTDRALVRRRSSTAGDEAKAAAVDDAGWQEIMSGGRALLVGRAERDPALVALRERLGCRDLLVAPLRAGDTVVGVLTVADRLGEVSTFDQENLRLFEALANHASVALESSRLLEQLRADAEERRHEALHDSLTGLPNRTLFSLTVDDQPDGAGYAVMLMDLDRFKEVNDTLGHHNGDLLLRAVAGRLLASLPPGDVAARLGGDEFAVLVRGLDDPVAAQVVARRILDALDQPFLIDELSLAIGASVGIALAPRHGHQAAALLQRADVAMYEAKAKGGGSALYSAERDTSSPRRLRLAGELRRAIDHGDLVVHYQPKADLATGVTVGVEALVRWRHPELGVLAPDEFIAVAEQTGLITPLTSRVLADALADCAQWRRQGHDVGVAVNLAVRSLLDVGLPAEVSRLLAASDVPADRLTLEITESSIMADPARTIAVLERLAGVGVHLSVDDFGTGYSSLTYLRRLPVQEVKIDKSFVVDVAHDAADAAIVQSIVELGHHLRLRVVAEGVEDGAAWERLRALSCDVAQGYLLGRPMPAPDLAAWLAGHPTRALPGRPGPADLALLDRAV